MGEPPIFPIPQSYSELLKSKERDVTSSSITSNETALSFN